MKLNDKLKELYLKNQFSIVIPDERPAKTEEEVEKTKRMAATVACNFADLNMILSPKMIEDLSLCSEEDISNFYSFYMPMLKEMVNYDIENYEPFYPGFPEQVIELKYFEDVIDQLIYAYSGFKIKPTYEIKKEVFPYIDKGDVKMLKSGSEKDFEAYIENLLCNPVMYKESDKEVIKEFIKSNSDYLDYLSETPSKIKENNIFLLNEIKKYNKEFFMTYATRYLKTPTDVLRYAVSVLDGDISLNGRSNIVDSKDKPIPFSFSRNKRYKDITRSLNKSEINEIYTLLANTRMIIEKDYPNLVEIAKQFAKIDGTKSDFVLVDDAVQSHKKYFKSFAKVAHVNPNKCKNNVDRALSAICNNKTISINSIIEHSLSNKDLDTAVNVLSYRPTVFAKNLSKLSEIAIETNKKDILLDEYQKIAKKTSVESLLSVRSYFEKRKQNQEERNVVVHGVRTTLPDLPALDNDFCNKMIDTAKEGMKEKFKNTPSLGKVYIDKSMCDIKVPKNNIARNENKTSYPYTFGSSLPENNEEIKEIILDWENGLDDNPSARIDLDLSAFYIKKDNELDFVSWNGYKSESGIVFSGDCRDANDNENGVGVEKLQFNVNELKENNVKGVCLNVAFYTSDDGAKFFSKLSRSPKFTITERSESGFGDSFEAKTVVDTFELTNDCKCVTPIVYDVEKNHFIFLNREHCKDYYDDSIAASSYAGGIKKDIIEAFDVNKYYPSFAELIKVQNCDIVDNLEDAEVVFSTKEIDDKKLKPNAVNVVARDYQQLISLLNEKRENNDFILRDNKKVTEKSLDEIIGDNTSSVIEEINEDMYLDENAFVDEDR